MYANSVANDSPVVTISLSVRSTSSVLPIRVSPTLRAIPNITLVELPMNTSPWAPTYSISSDVLIALVTVTERLHEEASSPSTVTLAPTVRSKVLLSSSMRATPIPVTVEADTPSLVLVSSSLLLLHTLAVVCDSVVTVPVVHSVFDFDPGGSRSTMSIRSGPAVTKLLPVGSEPRMIPEIGTALFQW